MNRQGSFAARINANAVGRGGDCPAVNGTPRKRGGYGRPATFSTGDTTQFKRAIDMTDDELAAIVAKARLTIVK